MPQRLDTFQLPNAPRDGQSEPQSRFNFGVVRALRSAFDQSRIFINRNRNEREILGWMGF